MDRRKLEEIDGHLAQARAEISRLHNDERDDLPVVLINHPHIPSLRSVHLFQSGSHAMACAGAANWKDFEIHTDWNEIAALSFTGKL